VKLPHLEWASRDSPYLQQHQLGFRSLSDGELEESFKRYHANVFLIRMRWALWLVAMLLALVFVVLDAFNTRTRLRGRVPAVRLGVMQPMLLLAQPHDLPDRAARLSAK
jgi:hypothetical protein